MERCVIGNGGHARCLAVLIGSGTLCIGAGEEPPADAELYVGVGLPSQRRNIFNYYAESHEFPPFDHISTVCFEFQTADGIQLMPGSIVMPGVKIYENVLVNTGAQIDHDCIIGAHSVIAPGAILCGNVTLGEACHIGAGAIIVQGVKLESGAFVPAGTLVCGPTDFRRPPRAILAHRAAETENSASLGDAGNV